MGNLRTLAKKLDDRRTWKVTFRGPDGRWYAGSYNQIAVAAKKQRVRLPSKRERAVMRELAKAQAAQPSGETGELPTGEP